jgi:tRNA threonylcarbamoyl adenosine modification protein (Sua5/YciO/YrdC/YwlC family)
MAAALAGAVSAAEHGDLVVYPTDTLWGLGADATNRAGVAALCRAKGRPSGQPISVAVSSTEEVEPLAVLTPGARRFLRDQLPGPFTVLLPASPSARRILAPEILGPAATIGIRVPDHPLAREFARRVGVVTATSANRHGEPPCSSLRDARACFGTEVSVYLGGAPPPSGRPSTLVDLRRATPHRIARS